MEKMNITNQEHDAFVKSHPQGDLLQLTKWAETKQLTGWYSRRVAVGAVSYTHLTLPTSDLV